MFCHVDSQVYSVQGSEKVASSCLQQEYFPIGQVTFHSHLSDGQEIKRSSHLPAKSLKEQTKTCPGQAEFESYLPQGRAGIFQVFFEPCMFFMLCSYFHSRCEL